MPRVQSSMNRRATLLGDIYDTGGQQHCGPSSRGTSRRSEWIGPFLPCPAFLPRGSGTCHTLPRWYPPSVVAQEVMYPCRPTRTSQRRPRRATPVPLTHSRHFVSGVALLYDDAGAPIDTLCVERYCIIGRPIQIRVSVAASNSSCDGGARGTTVVALRVAPSSRG